MARCLALSGVVGEFAACVSRFSTIRTVASRDSVCVPCAAFDVVSEFWLHVFRANGRDFFGSFTDEQDAVPFEEDEHLVGLIVALHRANDIRLKVRVIAQNRHAPRSKIDNRPIPVSRVLLYV